MGRERPNPPELWYGVSHSANHYRRLSSLLNVLLGLLRSQAKELTRSFRCERYGHTITYPINTEFASSGIVLPGSLFYRLGKQVNNVCKVNLYAPH